MNKYVDRELSWLSFNGRVLQEAADKRVPLLMRLKFLGIFSNNQDEFFRVRVASLRRILAVKKKKAKVALGFNPKKILKQINETVVMQHGHFERIFAEIREELAEYNIYIVNETELTKLQGKKVREYFHAKVRTWITPLMIDEVDEFPRLKDGCIYLAIHLYKKNDPTDKKYALVELPTEHLSRFFVFERSKNRTYVILLDNVIRYCLEDLFFKTDYDQFKAYTVKITKDAEMNFDQDVSKSFLELLQIGLKKRKAGKPVRFIYDQEINSGLLHFITKKLEFSQEDSIIAGGRYHNFKDFMKFPDLGPPEIHYHPLPVLKHKAISPTKSIFKLLKKQDVLLHFPYQAFDPLIDFLREAAIDPDVKYIKATLYRLAKHSKIIQALLQAKKNGKNVLVIIELQARFDEEANIKWAEELQENGVRVIHGQPGIKVHSKLLLVGREEDGKIVRYANIGTGNFNESTALLYTDEHLMTAHKGITKEVNKVFDFLENNTPQLYKHLLVSPYHMQKSFLELIDIEIQNALAGQKAYIIAKMNSLNEEKMINKLYEASQAGVKIFLIVRGICCLVPGIKGLSDNIQAISIVDRYLEHARIFLFANGGKEKCYLASADWLERNLHRRVEVACPIYDPQLIEELKTILVYQLKDNTKARWLNHEEERNVYKRVGKESICAQEMVHAYFNKQLNTK